MSVATSIRRVLFFVACMYRFAVFTVQDLFVQRRDKRLLKLYEETMAKREAFRAELRAKFDAENKALLDGFEVLSAADPSARLDYSRIHSTGGDEDEAMLLAAAEFPFAEEIPKSGFSPKYARPSFASSLKRTFLDAFHGNGLKPDPWADNSGIPKGAVSLQEKTIYSFHGDGTSSVGPMRPYAMAKPKISIDQFFANKSKGDKKAAQKANVEIANTILRIFAQNERRAKKSPTPVIKK